MLLLALLMGNYLAPGIVNSEHTCGSTKAAHLSIFYDYFFKIFSNKVSLKCKNFYNHKLLILFYAAFKFGRPVHFALRRKMRNRRLLANQRFNWTAQIERRTVSKSFISTRVPISRHRIASQREKKENLT